MGRRLRGRLVASRNVFAGRLISVQVDELVLSDGSTTTREIVSHPGAVAVVPLLPRGRVVMIRQYRHAAGKALWELPAGTLRQGEAPEECAHRELIEEIGYEAGRLEPLFSFYLSPGYTTELMHLFLGLDLRPARTRADSDERIEVMVLAMEEALAMVERGEVQNAAAICGLLAAARRGLPEAARGKPRRSRNQSPRRPGLKRDRQEGK